ncbi:MAG: hypothetical protein F4Y50_10350 [Dehalococcoidia bacterium]|nr:hypothetical protein [Dehalococcoidia bacterium]
MITRLTVPITAVLALVVLVGCSESPRPSVNAPNEQSGTEASASPTSVPSPSPTATVEPTADSDEESLPPFVQILSPEYQDAYRLLPEGPWAKEYIARQFDWFDFEKWQILEWEDSIEIETNYELDAWKELQWKRLLQEAESDSDFEEWLIGQVRGIDPKVGQQFETVKNVSGRIDLVRKLIEVEGHYIDVEAILVEWEGRKVGHSDELIAYIVEDLRDMHETSLVWFSLQGKASDVHSAEIDICNLLMDTVAGEHPRSVIIDGNCEIEKAIEIAQENLAANGGQFARTEEDFRHWIEFADSVESEEHDANRGEYVNPNPDDDEDGNYDG